MPALPKMAVEDAEHFPRDFRLGEAGIPHPDSGPRQFADGFAQLRGNLRAAFRAGAPVELQLKGVRRLGRVVSPHAGILATSPSQNTSGHTAPGADFPRAAVRNNIADPKNSMTKNALRPNPRHTSAAHEGT